MVEHLPFVVLPDTYIGKVKYSIVAAEPLPDCLPGYICYDPVNANVVGTMNPGTYANDTSSNNTNIFRPRSVEFASTFPREEMFFLLDKFAKWNATIVFLGHVHKWDQQNVNGIEYLTLDSMCEENNPEPGDYLVRVKCGLDGGVTWEKVHMNYKP